MRIAIVTNDAFFAALSLRQFAREQASNVVAVIVTTQLPGVKDNRSGVRKILRETGAPYLALKVIANVVLPRISRLRGGVTTLTALLESHGCQAPVRHAVRADSPEMCAWLRSLDVDVLLSAGATHRFNDELLSVPRQCAVNMHPSLLPRYRGSDPYIWCLLNGDSETGVTLHITAPSLDSGDIVAQRRISTQGHKSVFALQLEMAEANDRMLAEFFRRNADCSTRTPQDESARSFYRRPTREQLRGLRSRGLRLIDLGACRQALRLATARA